MSKTVASDPDPPWPGFYAPLYTQVPDELFDYWLPRLSEAELKVLLYIIRRTFGFKKTSDDIALSQMVHGIVTTDGRRLDYGAGVSAASVKRGVQGLIKKRLIEVQRNRSPERGHEPTTYRLRLRADPTPLAQIEQREGINLSQGEGAKLSQGEGGRVSQALRSRRTPQETVVQERVYQEDDSNRAAPQKEKGAEERPPYSPYIAQVVLDLSRELGDLNGPSNVTQALRLWQVSGLDEQAFVEMLQAAKRGVRKAQAHGVANKGAYWMAVLRDQFGVRED